MQQRENLLDVIGLLYGRRALIAKVTGVAAVLSVLISLLLPVYYEASTLFLAASPDQSNPSKIYNSTVDANIYGTGNDIERLIAAANSERVTGFLIDTFDLYAVYEIERDADKARQKMRETFAKRYSVMRTRYDEIEISFEDRDPARAAAVANAARERLGVVMSDMVQSATAGTERALRTVIASKEARRRELTDSIRNLQSATGIIGQSQGSAIAGLLSTTDQQLAADSALVAYYRRARVRGAQDSVAKITGRLESQLMVREKVADQLGKFSEVNGELLALQAQVEIVAEQVGYNRETLRQIEAAGSGQASVLYLLDPARVPDAKSRPARALIVVATTLAAFLLACLGVIAFDSYKDVEWSRYVDK